MAKKRKSLVGWVDKNFKFKVYTPKFGSWKDSPFWVLPRVTLKKKYKIRSRIDKIRVRITIEEIR